MTYDLCDAEKALLARVRKSIENNRSVILAGEMRVSGSSTLTTTH